MPTGKDLTEVSTFTAAVHVPKTSEDVSAATLELPLQSLTNRTKFLKDKDTAIDVVDAAQNATLAILRGAVGLRAFQFVSADPSSAGQWDSTTGNGTWTQIGVGGINRALSCPIDTLPTGSIITRIDVCLTGGAHGAQPAVRPAWYLYRLDNTGGTLLTSLSDTTTVPGSYTSAHTISKTGLSITVDNTSSAYTLLCYGEAGANSSANVLQIFMAYVYFTAIA